MKRNIKKILVLGLVLTYMCIATGCTRDDNTNKGDMAGTGTQNETGATTDNGMSNTTETFTTETSTTETSTTESVTGTGGADATDDHSLLDDAGDAVGNVVDDVTDGVSDVTNDLIGDGNTSTTETTTENTNTAQ